MSGQIALVGGDEFRPGCEDMDREIMRASGKDPATNTVKVVVVPTAAVTGPAKAANDGATHFGALGGDSSRLMLLERGHAEDPAFFSPASLADVVYFTGGSPDYLLETVRESPFLSALLASVEAGTVLAGSSAGAMVMGSMMRGPSSGGWASGLGLAPGVAVLPHHEGSDPDRVASELASTVSAGLKVLGIDARTGCFGSPGHWAVLGLGRVVLYENGAWRAFEHGGTLPPHV